MTITYDVALRDRIQTHLAGHDRRVVTDPTKKHAAVAVVLVDSEVGEDRVDPAPVEDWIDGRPMPESLDGRMVDVSGGAAFLLCRRTSRLSSHAAQWALPGGRVDPGETAVDGALRELDEEVGVVLPDSAVLGLLDDYPTRSGYVITPVVIWGSGRLDLRPAPDEVVAVYRVGLHQLMREDSPRFITIPESPRPVVQIPLGNDLIHAPTGAVLLQLRWLGLEGRGDAVDDYPTRSGYVISPVVIWGSGRLDLRPAPDEVVAVYRVGLHQLMREDSPRFITIPESPRPVVQIPLGNDLIHAPTGAVLLQLRWLGLEGRDDAVDDLEQPVFAWK